MFLKFWKTSERTSVVEFLITGASTTGSLQNDRLWKNPRKSASVLEKETPMDALLKGFPNVFGAAILHKH